MTAKINKKIGLIGVGNMGTAILEGLFAQKMASPAQVFVYDKITDKSKAFAKQWKATAVASNADVLKQSDVIILAVKPQDLKSTAEEFAKEIRKDQIFISILAGTTMARIQTAISKAGKIVRAMPNLGAKVGQAITALVATDAEALTLAEQIFSGCGKTVRLEEKYFDYVTAISGSGPAYFFHLMELLANEGKRNGFSDETARIMAVQTAVGAALLAQSAAESPAALRQMVTSKGGTTEAALKVLNDAHFPEIFQKAIEAAAERGKELSQMP